MNLEIERKFKLKEIPRNLKYISKEKIIQGYIAIVENGTEVRIRKSGNKYFETIKGRGRLVRKEIEIQLTNIQFKELWPLTKDKRIKKDRYTFILRKKIVELDIYSGELENLIIIEIEFSSVIESKKFIPPKWFGIEVTNNPKYKNKNLAS